MTIKERNIIVDLLHGVIDRLKSDFDFSDDSFTLVLEDSKNLSYRIKSDSYFGITFKHLKTIFDDGGIDSVAESIVSVYNKAVEEEFTERICTTEGGYKFYSWNYYTTDKVNSLLNYVCLCINLIDSTLKAEYIKSNTHYAIELKDHNGDMFDMIHFFDLDYIYMKESFVGVKSFIIKETIKQLSKILDEDEEYIQYWINK